MSSTPSLRIRSWKSKPGPMWTSKPHDVAGAALHDAGQRGVGLFDAGPGGEPDAVPALDPLAADAHLAQVGVCGGGAEIFQGRAAFLLDRPARRRAASGRRRARARVRCWRRRSGAGSGFRRRPALGVRSRIRRARAGRPQSIRARTSWPSPVSDFGGCDLAGLGQSASDCRVRTGPDCRLGQSLLHETTVTLPSPRGRGFMMAEVYLGLYSHSMVPGGLLVMS